MAAPGQGARGTGWVIVRLDREHIGLKLWGRPSESEAVSEALDALPRRSRFVVADLRSLVVTSERDLGRLGQVLSSLMNHVRASGAPLMIFRSRGLGGVIVTGALAAFTDLGSLRLPVDALEGLSGLRGRAERLVRALLGPVDASDSGETPFADDADLRCLRALLREGPQASTLAAAARKLGTSTRSLQRRLALHGTSFSRELQHARVDAAKGLLLASDDKVSHIAERVGCCSAQHLARIFRRHASETPQAYRRRHA